MFITVAIATTFERQNKRSYLYRIIIAIFFLEFEMDQKKKFKKIFSAFFFKK